MKKCKKCGKELKVLYFGGLSAFEFHGTETVFVNGEEYKEVLVDGYYRCECGNLEFKEDTLVMVGGCENVRDWA